MCLYWLRIRGLLSASFWTGQQFQESIIFALKSFLLPNSLGAKYFVWLLYTDLFEVGLSKHLNVYGPACAKLLQNSVIFPPSLSKLGVCLALHCQIQFGPGISITIERLGLGPKTGTWLNWLWSSATGLNDTPSRKLLYFLYGPRDAWLRDAWTLYWDSKPPLGPVRGVLISEPVLCSL